MRGDKLGSPVLSTYAVGGGAARQHRGGPTSRPAGPCSSGDCNPRHRIGRGDCHVSFEGDTASVAERQAGSSNQASRDYPDGVAAGPSIDFADVPLAVEDLDDNGIRRLGGRSACGANRRSCPIWRCYRPSGLNMLRDRLPRFGPRDRAPGRFGSASGASGRGCLRPTRCRLCHGLPCQRRAPDGCRAGQRHARTGGRSGGGDNPRPGGCSDRAAGSSRRGQPGRTRR
jgi:hypothetical protein